MVARQFATAVCCRGLNHEHNLRQLVAAGFPQKRSVEPGPVRTLRPASPAEGLDYLRWDRSAEIRERHEGAAPETPLDRLDCNAAIYIVNVVIGQLPGSGSLPVDDGTRCRWQIPRGSDPVGAVWI